MKRDKRYFLSSAAPSAIGFFARAAAFATSFLTFFAILAAPRTAFGAPWAFSPETENAAARSIKFCRVVGMVYEAKTSRGLKDCDIRIGRLKTRTDENGYFEISSVLYDEYVITASRPPFRRHIDVIRLDAPLKAVKIYLEMPEVKISETKKANREYDGLLARIMSGSVNEITVNGDEKRMKPSYASKFGAKQAGGEGAGGRGYSKKSSGEVSKAPHISADRGFGLLVCSVFETSGAEIENNARIVIATQAVETLRSRPVEIHNVPVGSYTITVKCEGYADKVYEKVAVRPGKNERSFFIEKSKKQP